MPMPTRVTEAVLISPQMIGRLPEGSTATMPSTDPNPFSIIFLPLRLTHEVGESVKLAVI